MPLNVFPNLYSKYRWVEICQLFFICISSLQFAAGDELELLIHPTGVIPVLTFLKGNHSAQFTNLTFICGVDVPTRKNRFEVSKFHLDFNQHACVQVVYSLYSVRFNARIRIRTYTDEIAALESATPVFRGADWYFSTISFILVLLLGLNEKYMICTEFGLIIILICVVF